MAATVWHILNMQWIQSPETENNVNRLKFDWKNSRNLITWSEFIKSIFYSFNKSHPSLRVQVQDRRIWNLWKLPPFQRSVIRLPRMKTSLTLKKMTVMMMLTKVRTTKFSIFSPLRSDKTFKLQEIGQKNRENEGDRIGSYLSKMCKHISKNI